MIDRVYLDRDNELWAVRDGVLLDLGDDVLSRVQEKFGVQFMDVAELNHGPLRELVPKEAPRCDGG